MKATMTPPVTRTLTVEMGEDEKEKLIAVLIAYYDSPSNIIHAPFIRDTLSILRSAT